MFIPFVNFITWIILCIDVAKSFGKGVGFAIGLILLPFIFFLILGFGSAQYQGPSASPGVAVSPPPQSLLRPPAKRAGCRLRGATACQGKPPFLDLTPRESSVPKVPDAALRVSPLPLAEERTKVRGWLSETLS
jgi:Family of unknown function (DUF5684)